MIVDRADAENKKNQKINRRNTSGFIGVHWNSQVGKWTAQIVVGGRSKHLGLFDSLEAAVQCRRAAEANLGFHENHGRAES